MLKFIEREVSKRDMLQFIINLLYLGMKSGDCCWAEANGTQQAVINLLYTVSDDFIKVANDILVNGSITINSDQRRLATHIKVHKDIEEYQDIVDILRTSSYEYYDYFSCICKDHFKRLTERFSVREDPNILKS